MLLLFSVHFYFLIWIKTKIAYQGRHKVDVNELEERQVLPVGLEQSQVAAWHLFARFLVRTTLQTNHIIFN